MAPTTADVKYAEAAIGRVTAENGIDYAYRDLGRGDIPIVLLQHFRGNLDNWDPALIDALAAERRVVTFDNVGVGGTGGSTPSTVEEMAHGAIAFTDAMGFEQVDLLGFSIGSMVAQEIALIRPEGLRRVVLASSAPQGGCRHARLGAGRDRRGRRPGAEPPGIPGGLLRPHGHEPPGGPGGRRAHLRENGKPARAD